MDLMKEWFEKAMDKFPENEKEAMIYRKHYFREARNKYYELMESRRRGEDINLTIIAELLIEAHNLAVIETKKELDNGDLC